MAGSFVKEADRTSKKIKARGRASPAGRRIWVRLPGGAWDIKISFLTVRIYLRLRKGGISISFLSRKGGGSIPLNRDFSGV